MGFGQLISMTVCTQEQHSISPLLPVYVCVYIYIYIYIYISFDKKNRFVTAVIVKYQESIKVMINCTDRSGRVVQNIGLRPCDCWYRKFESR
jgi:hypothetical protein